VISRNEYTITITASGGGLQTHREQCEKYRKTFAQVLMWYILFRKSPSLQELNRREASFYEK